MIVHSRSRLLLALTLLLAAGALAAACGSGAQSGGAQGEEIPSPSLPASGHLARTRLLDWPEFGLDPQRSSVSAEQSGIAASQLGHLRRVTVRLPGTVDSSPIYLHSASVGGRIVDVALLTTTYGKTLAIDASDGRVLWTFTPPGYAQWAGTAQITTASPLADPDRAFVYAASPDGLIHKLSLADGSEDRTGAWPVRITRDPTHEKITPALNIDGAYLLAATGGYYGDAPPYQGHVVLIARSSGRVRAVFNTLCADRHTLIAPASCPASDSAILSRGGPVVEPDGRVLIDTGNGPWDGRRNFGDSLLELTFPDLRLRQAFTPTDQASLNASDTDLGSGSPALLGHGRALVAGKDGVMRVLDLSRLDGHPPTAGGPAPRERLGGEVQTLPTPGGAQFFTAPAVWREGTHTIVFVADASGTAAYVLRSGRLRLGWENHNPGTSPVMAGGLLYVYDPPAGGIRVYRPASPRPIAKLPGAPGHWNSPIVLDGHVLEPEGDGNEHRLDGTLDLFSASP
ncbi:MAG TPA: PQQ-binding-like beta-propeller repeat protein [Solirubrobacteraceae bacterium]|jgi:hypothetical protein|nr:PQQ-binding-like beta-propeller repeat protein [Solirubrobacteraceae bacterium]